MTTKLVLVSNHIFTSREERSFPGFVAIRGGRIAAVGQLSELSGWVDTDTKVCELGDQFVMPGIHDNHVFFTGYMSMNRGVNLAGTASAAEALERLLGQAGSLMPSENLYAYGWDQESWGGIPDQRLLDEAFPDRPVIAINRTKSWCWMNQTAIGRYGFTPGNCSAEARALLLQDMLRDRDKVKEEFLAFSSRMASLGVTSIRDIGFDRYELLPLLSEWESLGQLPLRVHFSLEPVLESLHPEIGVRYRSRYNSDRLRFQGYKIMVDGVVADHTGDMLEEYHDLPGVTCLKDVDYRRIEDEVLEADRHGLKCCLTAEGDAAIRRAVSILEKCRREQGALALRHSISDLEYPHPDDLKRMGELGIVAEVYAQILLLNPSHEASYMREVAGAANEPRFHNYRSMLDAGITVTIGTDLPLFMTSVPDSIYAANMRLFPDGSPAGGWYPERGMSVAEILRAWTLNGAKHNGMEAVTGSLEAGKYADIAVFDRNLLDEPASEIRKAQVVMTINNGRIVYDMTQEKRGD